MQESLSEQDLDITKLTIRPDSPLAQAARDLIADRREYRRIKTEKAQTAGKSSGCELI